MTVCLTAIVKNEAHVIRRMLASARPHIDSWVVVDTGSTDGTQDIVLDAMQGLPGKLHRREWRGFGDARTTAFQVATGAADYALVMDADDILHGELPKKLTHDAYGMWLKFEGGARGLQHRLFSLKHAWRYEGSIHELPTCDRDWAADTIETAWVTTPQDGARSLDPKKHRKVAELIGEELINDPHDARLVFHLAFAWRDAGDDERAVRHFKQRIEMGLHGEEPYIAWLEAGRALNRLGRSGEAIAMWMNAHAYWPQRCEAPRELWLAFLNRAHLAKDVGTLYNEFHCSTELVRGDA